MARCFAFLSSVYYITPAPLRAGIMLHNRPDAVTGSTFAEHWRLVTDAAAPLAHVIIHKAFGCFLCSAHVTVMYGGPVPAGVWRRRFYFRHGQKVHPTPLANVGTFSCPHPRDAENVEKVAAFANTKNNNNNNEVVFHFEVGLVELICLIATCGGGHGKVTGII